MTLKKWLTVWYDTFKVPKLSDNSLRNIESTVRLHIPNTLKYKELSDITSFDVELLLSSIGGCRTAVYVRQILYDAFSHAYKYGFVSKNVMLCVSKVRYKKSASCSLTIQEQEDFLSSVEDSKYEKLFKFYLYTGCRCSEALTLKRGDIDFVAKTILIRGTKNYSSYRTIPLTPILESLMLEYVDVPMITPIFPYSREIVSRTFKRFCPNHHLHDLRHTFITRCAEQGVNISVCQQIVGHSTSSLTLDIYTHVVDEFKRREFNKLKF